MANLQFPIYQKSLCEDLKKTFLKRSTDTDSTRGAEEVVSEVSDMLSTDIAVYAEKLLKEMSSSSFEGLDRILRSKLDVDVFSELFTALDSSGIPVDLSDKDAVSRIATIRANYGFWGVDFISALGKSTGGDIGDIGGGSGVEALYELVDVKPNASGDGVLGAKEGTALVYNGTYWVAGEAGLSETQLNSYLTTNEYVTKSDVYTKNDVYTKKEVDDLLAALKFFEKVNVGTDDSPRYALHILESMGLYSDDFISALGKSTTGGTGGGGVSYGRLDSWEGYDETKSEWVLSAGLGYSLRTDIDTLEGTIAELAGRSIYWSDIKNTPSTLKGYGIVDAYTKSEVDELVLFEKVNIGTEENPVWAIHAKDDMGIYSDKFISALGVSGIGDTTGLYERLDSWDSYSSEKAEWVLSAYLGNDLNSRVKALEYLKSGHKIVVEGNGSIITNVEENVDTLTFSKGDLSFSKVVDKPNTLKGYGITDGVNSFEISGEGNAFTGCNIDGHKIIFTKGETFLPKATFDELFEKVNIGTQETPIYAIRAKYGFYSDGFVSAMGINNGAGSPGLFYERLDNWSDYTEDKAEWVLSAALGYSLNTRVIALEELKKGHTISISGSGNVVTNVAENGNTLTFTKSDLSFTKIIEKPTTIAGYGITDAKISNGVITLGGGTIKPLTAESNLAWGKITGTPTTLSGYGITDGVNAYSVSGAGNAFTGVSISGHTITFTKGGTFLPKATFDDLFEKVNVGTTDSPVYAIRAKYGLYSDSFITAMGYGSSSTGAFDRLDNWDDYDDAKATWVLSAYLGNTLNERVSYLENNPQGHTIVINGSGNVLTNVVESGSKLTFTKGEIIWSKIKDVPLGTANGLATLDASGKVPSAQLPSYVDDVLECINKASFPTTGESGKIYIDQTTNLTYRWGGTAYVEISQSLALGETSSTAYAGDKGKQNATDIAALKTGKADKATTLAGYGITDAYTKTQTYTQAEVNTKLTDGSVTKVGKVDVGSTTKPIYLKAGVPTAVGTSLAVDITGNSATTSKLKTAVTLWGQSFDGSKAITGNLTNVGTITPTGEDLKVVGNLIVTGGIVMYADDGASIESGFAALLAAHIDGVTIKYNSDEQKIYSVMSGIAVNGTTYKPNETTGIITIPDYPTSLDWDNIDGKPSTFTPSSHTHTFASLTSKPTTIAGYGITDAKIVNGVITLGTATITPLTAHQTVTLASGTNNGTLKLTVNGTATDNIAVKGLGSAAFTASSAYAAASHTHAYLPLSGGTMTGNLTTTGIISKWAFINTGDSTLKFYDGKITDAKSDGNICLQTSIDGTDGQSHAYPTQFGSRCNLVLQPRGGQVYIGTNPDGGNTSYKLYVNGNVYASSFTGNASSASKWATARKITLTGSVTGEVSIDGSGDVSLATTTNHTHSYLPLSGGTMGGTAWIVWPDSGNWGNSNSGVTFPVTRGGLHWIGQSDWVKLFSQETGDDNLNLVLQFGDDNSNGLSIRNSGGSQTAFISATGHISAANGTVNGTLKVGTIPVTNSSSGVLKIDGSLIVTGGITMYATDGVASGLMEQILVDGTTIKKKADGTLYVDPAYVGGGTVKGATVGGTAVTLDSATGILQFPAYPTATNKAATLAWNTTSTIATVAGTDITVKLPANPNTDTKNTAGSTDTSSKIFLIGATSQAANPQTYSHDTAYVGTDGCLYSGGTKVSVSGHTHSYLPLSGGTLTNNLTIQTGGIWVQGGSAAGSDNTRMSLVSGMPDGLAYNTSKRGVRIYSNAIAFADPYNGNSNNDAGWIRHLETTGNSGTLEIATGDDGNESIVVRKYNTSSAVVKEAYLLNSSGNTTFPGTVSASGFIKSGSSDSYVLLGGGGHKAVSDFATSGHTHSYLPLSGGTITGDLSSATIKGKDGSNRLIFRHLDGQDCSGNYDLYLQYHQQNSVIYLNGGTYKIYNKGANYNGNAASATKLTSSAGSATLPIYFSDGKPVACTASSVFSNLTNSGNNISITVAGQNRTLTVGYATTSSMLKTSTWSGGAYASSDTHYMCLGYMNCTGNYDALTLLITSAFWGNQHGSQDIITIQQSTNTNSTAVVQPTVGRLRLGGSTERSFYYYKDNTNLRLYLYVYVTGGNSYGKWNISYLGGNASWVTAHSTNVTKGSSWVTIGYSAQGNYANSSGNSDTCDGLHVHGGRNNEANKIVRTDGNGYLQVGYINSSSGNEGNNSSPARVWGTNGSDNYMRTYLTSALSVNYAASAGTASYAHYLNSNSRMEYGWNGVNYFNANLTAGCTAKANDAPSSAWWHIMRFNHANSNGYYTDLAIPFNSNSLYWKCVRSGSLAASSWVKVLDSLNYNEYAPTKTGTGASGTWGISISGNAATASKWATARTITLTGSVTGSVSIDGSGNVTLATTTNHTHSYLPLAGGNMTGPIGVHSNTRNGGLKFNNNAANLNALNDQHLILGKAIRFGAYDTWDWNVWAGLKYDHANKTIYLGLADGTTFNANSAQSGGSLRFPGVSTVYAPTFSGSLSGNASTATKLQTARTIWGQSFNGNNNVDGTLTMLSTFTSSGIYPSNNYILLKVTNGSTVWEAARIGTYIKANNGSIDGYPAGLAFYTKPAGQYTLSAELRMVIDAGGNVGIGITSPSEKLHVVGNILASGGITMYSDLRKKNILSDEVLSVKEIAAAPLFAHTYKSDENHYLHIGTSAQYWSAIHEGWFTRKDSEGYYQMELQNLGVAMGISLAREIVTFEGTFKKYESKTDKKIRHMKKKINDLEARIKELEGSMEERRTA